MMAATCNARPRRRNRQVGQRPVAMHIATFLLLGVIVNVAVAWGCALWINEQAELLSPERSGSMLASAYDEQFTQLHVQYAAGGSGIGVHRAFVIAVATTSASSRQTPLGVTSVSSGWPLLAVRGQRVFRNPVAENDGAWLLPDALRDHISARIPGLLPWHPIWFGFAVNALFYAALLWLLIAAPPLLRRRDRVKRGLCSRCAYPVAAGQSRICPECGTTVPIRSSPATAG